MAVRVDVGDGTALQYCQNGEGRESLHERSSHVEKVKYDCSQARTMPNAGWDRLGGHFADSAARRHASGTACAHRHRAAIRLERTEKTHPRCLRRISLW